MRKNGNKIISIILGVLLIILGFYLLNKPLTTLLSAAIILAVGILARGISAGIGFFKKRSETGKNDALLIITAILYIIFGLILLINPGLSASVVLYLVAFWFIFDGITGLYTSSAIGFAIKWIGIVLSVILLIFGISLLFNPLRALWALNILVGVSLIVNGFQTIFGSIYLD
jgi:uncharacterized membrane protein HdeD (DUF308 family)